MNISADTRTTSVPITRGARFSLIILVVLFNAVMSFLIFRHVQTVKFPPLINISPCKMHKDALALYSFTTSGKEQPVKISGKDAHECEYHRDGYTYTNDFKRDEIIIDVLDKPQLFPHIFSTSYASQAKIYSDRVIVNNREIRESCGLDDDCAVFLEPNVIMHVIYRTGGTCQQDALMLARYFARDPLLVGKENS